MGACRLAACALALAACGRLGFDSRDDGGGGGVADSSGPDAAPPTGHAGAPVMVEGTGVANTSFEADATHMVFVDNTPGAAGDLVVFREGEGTTAVELDTSADGGATWTRQTVTPANTMGVNALGACQDTVTHAFHVSWLDTSIADQYARLDLKHDGAGHISDVVVEVSFSFFDDFADSPGPRDLTEIVDAAGNHRIAFAGTANTGTTGRVKLAVTSAKVGLLPASQGDWGPATTGAADGTDDQLEPNDFPTADGPETYMISIASNLAAGPGAPIVVAAGFPMDRQLLAWTITPLADSATTYAIAPPHTMSTTFGSGNGARVDANLGVATAPDGGVLIIHGDDAGLHVSRVDPTGSFAELGPQPTTDASVRHAVLATDAESRPVAMYIHSDNLFGTLRFGGAWLPEIAMTPAAGIAGAWPVVNAWRPNGVESFGAYLDAGPAAGTTFASVTWSP